MRLVKKPNQFLKKNQAFLVTPSQKYKKLPPIKPKSLWPGLIQKKSPLYIRYLGLLGKILKPELPSRGQKTTKKIFPHQKRFG
jgi:hypothetical protein